MMPQFRAISRLSYLHTHTHTHTRTPTHTHTQDLSQRLLTHTLPQHDATVQSDLRTVIPTHTHTHTHTHTLTHMRARLWWFIHLIQSVFYILASCLCCQALPNLCQMVKRDC